MSQALAKKRPPLTSALTAIPAESNNLITPVSPERNCTLGETQVQELLAQSLISVAAYVKLTLDIDYAYETDPVISPERWCERWGTVKRDKGSNRIITAGCFVTAIYKLRNKGLLTLPEDGPIQVSLL